MTVFFSPSKTSFYKSRSDTDTFVSFWAHSCLPPISPDAVVPFWTRSCLSGHIHAFLDAAPSFWAHSCLSGHLRGHGHAFLDAVASFWTSSRAWSWTRSYLS